MLAIKLRPVGKKKQISYRVVVMEKKSKLQGKFIEDLGWYNPHTNTCSLKQDRIMYWMHAGALPTDTVHNILIKEKVHEGAKIPKHSVSKKPQDESNKAQAGGQVAPQAEQATVPEEVKAEEPKVEEVAEVVSEVPAEPTGEEKKEDVVITEEKPAE